MAAHRTRAQNNRTTRRHTFNHQQIYGLNMLWLAFAVLGGFAFVFLTRLYWGTAASREPDQPPLHSRPLVRVAIVALVVALLVMIASGRVHWSSAAVAGVVPFLRRLTGALRYAPLLANLFGRRAQARPRPGTDNPPLTVDQARQMLEVAGNATEEAIIAAHRRLIARNHPDKGGSSYIAAQLNAARDLLLDELRSRR